MKTIFEYIDYRLFLKDFYAHAKARNRYFSYRVFARKASIKSPVFYKEVADGKKDLSRKMIEKFSVAFNLNEKEASYFKHLVLFNQAATSLEKQEHYANLRSMENIKSEKALSADYYDYFSSWYTVVIRELITQHDFKDDFVKLAKSLRPAIKPREARHAVDLLQKLNLIKKLADGTYRQVDTALTVQSGIASLAVRKLNKEMFSLAVTAYDEIPKTMRNMYGVTVGISPNMYEMICAEMAAFKDRVITLVNREEESSGVFQLNMQLFPMSRPVSPEDREGENT